MPLGLDEYIAEHKVGDKVSGRVLEVNGDRGRAELGEGIQAQARFTQKAAAESSAPAAKADLGSLTSMLQNKWKAGAAATSNRDQLAPGQIRTFQITRLDPESKKIEVELA